VLRTFLYQKYFASLRVHRTGTGAGTSITERELLRAVV
jgi:hypothetical protein